MRVQRTSSSSFTLCTAASAFNDAPFQTGAHENTIVSEGTLDYASTAQFSIHNRYANYADQYSNRSSFDFRRWLEAQDWFGFACQIFLYFSYGLHDNSGRYPLYEIRYMTYTSTWVAKLMDSNTTVTLLHIINKSSSLRPIMI